jgi:hypothetical protein
VLVQRLSGHAIETALNQALAFADRLKEIDARFYRMPGYDGTTQSPQKLPGLSGA